MANSLELPRGRLWLLTVRQRNIQIEYIVRDVQLAALIDGIHWDPEVQDLQCTPYRGSTIEGVWMATTAPLDAAA
jgi:hypothetical protein